MDQRAANLIVHGSLRKGEQESIQDLPNAVQSVITWLGPSDYQEPLRHAIKKRVSGTGQWLVVKPEFRCWKQDHNGDHMSRILWVHGAPGAGKSVLCGTTIEYFQKELLKNEDKPATTAYFFCDSGAPGKGTAFDICTSLLLQLQSKHEEPSLALRAAYRIAALHGRSHVSEADEVFALFCRAAAELPCSYVVIDALDECVDLGTVISWLQEATLAIPSLRVLIFSRNTMEIRKGLLHAPAIELTAESMKPDIETFLDKSLENLPCDTEQMRGHISEVLSRKADGMFLFVSLSLQTLQQATNIDDILEILENTPSGVYDMYTLILKRLATETDRRQALARNALRLLCTSTRPLTWPELRVALSWDTQQQDFRRTRTPYKDSILTLCCPLIEYRMETDTFRLVHLSLNEYLCTEQDRPSPQVAHFAIDKTYAHRELAQITLGQIAGELVSRSITVTGDEYPLVDYATKNWCHHLSRSPCDAMLVQKYLNFAACPDRRSIWMLRWLLSEDNTFPLQQIIKLQKMVQEWLQKGNPTTISTADTLSDVQRALFRLDQLAQATPDLRIISNFERLVCIRDLAREFTSAGKLDDGVQMFEEALLRASAENPDVSPGSCWLLNSLGILYDQQGKTSLAKETQQRALACQEQQLAPNHLDIVLTVNELGRIARHLGHCEEAESLHRRALSILDKLFDETDLHVTWTKSALGRSILKQGRPSEALPFHQQVLNVEIKRLGKDHPHTLWTMSDIVRCFRDLGQLRYAIDMQQEIVDRSKRVLGSRNSDTLWAMNSLGLLLEETKDYKMARTMQRAAFEGQLETLGEDHPHCLWTKNTLRRL
ncbi:MAG: hypothetical protein Q9166_004043 [cf. Caloplaca sp. 2 TL-2023]